MLLAIKVLKIVFLPLDSHVDYSGRLIETSASRSPRWAMLLGRQTKMAGDVHRQQHPLSAHTVEPQWAEMISYRRTYSHSPISLKRYGSIERLCLSDQTTAW